MQSVEQIVVLVQKRKNLREQYDRIKRTLDLAIKDQFEGLAISIPSAYGASFSMNPNKQGLTKEATIRILTFIAEEVQLELDKVETLLYESEDALRRILGGLEV